LDDCYGLPGGGDGGGDGGERLVHLVVELLKLRQRGRARARLAG